MHLFNESAHLLPQLGDEINFRAPSRLTVIERAAWDLAAEHFFEAHRLTAELKRVLRALFRLSALILHRIWLPQALAILEWDSPLIPAKFKHVARARHTERAGENAHIPRDEKVSPAFGERAVVRVFVQDRAIRRAVVFRPLVFDVDERPLPATELQVLQAGKLEKVLVVKVHRLLPVPIRVTFLR